MIEELTPQVLAVGLLVVIFLAPPLAFAIALLLLSRYRRAVVGAMARSAAPAALDVAPPPATVDALASFDDPDLLPSLLRARRRVVARVCLGGAAYALTIALALVVAMEPMRSPLGFALAAWGALWPVVPALWLTVPTGGRVAGIAGALYLLPLATILAVGLATPSPGPSTDTAADFAAAVRSGWSPPELIYAWLVFDAAPTALLLLVLNRWTRAVGPLVLAVASLLLAGVVAAFLALASARGFAMLRRATAASGVSPYVWLAAAMVMVLVAGLAVAWTVLRGVRAGYASKRANDRSITLDGAWLVFAAFHSMLFALVGLGWVAVGLLAFVVLRIVLGRLPLTRPALRAARPHGLVFLRVFSLGRRTEKLFDALSRDWRHRGSVQLIMGPDLARSTVQPHQMLDFVCGQLARHFVADAASLRRQIDACDRKPDRDGLYRINSLFCHADTWQAALSALVGQGDRVLMDLRSFGSSNAGCSVELQHLVHRVPLSRCLWVIDERTDAALLARTLRDAWRTMPVESPNAGSSEASAPLYRLGGRGGGVDPLLRRLAATG